jgi:hypothetical protein
MVDKGSDILDINLLMQSWDGAVDPDLIYLKAGFVMIGLLIGSHAFYWERDKRTVNRHICVFSSWSNCTELL